MEKRNEEEEKCSEGGKQIRTKEMLSMRRSREGKAKRKGGMKGLRETRSGGEAAAN